MQKNCPPIKVEVWPLHLFHMKIATTTLMSHYFEILENKKVQLILKEKLLK